jgi:hypothetical protein
MVSPEVGARPSDPRRVSWPRRRSKRACYRCFESGFTIRRHSQGGPFDPPFVAHDAAQAIAQASGAQITASPSLFAAPRPRVKRPHCEFGVAN